MKKRALMVIPLLFVLAGCAGHADDVAWSTEAPDSGLSESQSNCISAFTAMPSSATMVIAELGLDDPTEPSQACDAWLANHGETAFVSFWTDAQQFLPWSISYTRLSFGSTP
jgi:hypothetical protein